MIGHCSSLGIAISWNFSPRIHNASLLAIISNVLPMFSMRVVPSGWRNDCFTSSPIVSFAEISRGTGETFSRNTRSSDVTRNDANDARERVSTEAYVRDARGDVSPNTSLITRLSAAFVDIQPVRKCRPFRLRLVNAR